MRKTLIFLAGLALVVGIVAVAVTNFASSLQPDQLAPAFDLPGSDGERYRLDQFVGQQAVVLAWFPKADTGG